MQSYFLLLCIALWSVVGIPSFLILGGLQVYGYTFGTLTFIIVNLAVIYAFGYYIKLRGTTTNTEHKTLDQEKAINDYVEAQRNKLS